MLARAEFHPLAGRVVDWLLAVLRPAVRSAHPATDGGTFGQRVGLWVEQRGARVSIDCTQRVENRGHARVQLEWTLPQPPVASAHTVAVHLWDRAVPGQVYRRAEAESDARRAWEHGRPAVVLWQAEPVAIRMAAGWLPPSTTMEVSSHHRFALDPHSAPCESALRVQIDGALSLPAGPDRRPTGAPTSSLAARTPTLLAGVLARLARRAAGGFCVQSAARDRAVFRGRLGGCAARLLLVEAAPVQTAQPAPAGYEQVEHLLRAYRDRSPVAAERAGLARRITGLALEHGLVTPWTALIAAA